MEGYGNENPGAFQPTRPLRGTTVAPRHALWYIYPISTHAPLAGHDYRVYSYAVERVKFQPTRPLRGTTIVPWASSLALLYFNPRAPCGARRRTTAPKQRRETISTHAPLAGHDIKLLPLTTGEEKFQPTRPLRGTTVRAADRSTIGNISTHAPLAGHDKWSAAFSLRG